MYIKNIKLKNYRSYESLDLDLGKKTTVLIGKNGAGKTNMITALKQSLSFIFSKNQSISQPSFVAESGQSIKSFDTMDATRAYDDNGVQSQGGTWPISIKVKADIDEEKDLEWEFKREGLSEGMKETYSQASVRFWKRYADLEDMPVLAFFSDAFPHEDVRIGKKIQDKLSSPFGLSQSDGYYNWDDPRDCGKVWQQYFLMQYKNFMYGRTQNHELEYLSSIRKCMVEFSLPLEDAEENKDFVLKDVAVVARGKDEVVVLQFQNGMESDFASLPAGYMRAFSMAFDIANRAFILNKNCDPQGIVFIDEIDLHLHPSLAQEILERMQRTFKKVQFVVSTHSPLVISNFEQNESDNLIYRLCSNQKHNTTYQLVQYSYGVDYESLLTELMGTTIRNSELRKYISEYVYWRSAQEHELADMALNHVIKIAGPDSKVVKQLRQR